MQITYTTFQPTTVLHLRTDDALNGDSCTYVKAQDEGAGMFVAVEQLGCSGIVIEPDQWPVLRTEINRMFEQIAMHERKQAMLMQEQMLSSINGYRTIKTGCTD